MPPLVVCNAVETRKLTAGELERARTLLNQVRESLKGLSEGNPELLFAYRRKLAKELGHDERRKPMKRMALKRDLVPVDQLAGYAKSARLLLPPRNLGD
jgi:hypothetical protein